ncbi:hypothetical protein GYMLUDRAFT_90540 [Collybiopsis luxurians FD-317 M1]|nr:hypothetical protein GYMLUDRAFT_90540 [Collybiopsis luxurians FD-317 M1]
MVVPTMMETSSTCLPRDGTGRLQSTSGGLIDWDRLVNNIVFQRRYHWLIPAVVQNSQFDFRYSSARAFFRPSRLIEQCQIYIGRTAASTWKDLLNPCFSGVSVVFVRFISRMKFTPTFLPENIIYSFHVYARFLNEFMFVI